MYYYIINFWDEIDNETSEERGIVGASSYGEAAKKAVEYYGEKNVIDIKLYELESVICEDEIKDILNS